MRTEINIQWFPGHMTKARRKIEADLPMIDIVIELLDARIPLSSRNPSLREIIGDKPRLVLLNKSDLADANENLKWIKYFESEGATTLLVDCKNGTGIKKIVPTVKHILKEKIAKQVERSMVGRPIRAMILGIPNVGKSSLINRMTSSTSHAKVQDRPGVTRGNQWFKIDSSFELLDTPGVLWPKFDDMRTGERLAFTGAVKDEVVLTEELCNNLLVILVENYKELILSRYKLTEIDNEFPLEDIAKKRGMMLRGGEYDLERAAIMVLDEFRGGKIGRISLEKLD